MKWKLKFEGRSLSPTSLSSASSVCFCYISAFVGKLWNPALGLPTDVVFFAAVNHRTNVSVDSATRLERLRVSFREPSTIQPRSDGGIGLVNDWLDGAGTE